MANDELLLVTIQISLAPDNDPSLKEARFTGRLAVIYAAEANRGRADSLRTLRFQQATASHFINEDAQCSARPLIWS